VLSSILKFVEILLRSILKFFGHVKSLLEITCVQ